MTERKKQDKQPIDTHQVTPDPEETPKKGSPLERAILAKKHPAEDDPKVRNKDKNVEAGKPLEVGVDPSGD